MGLRGLGGLLFAAIMMASGLGELAHRLAHHYQTSLTHGHRHNGWCPLQAALKAPECRQQASTSKTKLVLQDTHCDLDALLALIEEIIPLVLALSLSWIVKILSPSYTSFAIAHSFALTLRRLWKLSLARGPPFFMRPNI